MRSRGISLANKCQLLFGLAVLLILTAALAVPWFRIQGMVNEGQREFTRQLADAWLTNVIEVGSIPHFGWQTVVERAEPPRDQSAEDVEPEAGASDGPARPTAPDLRIGVFPLAQADSIAMSDEGIAAAVERFRMDPNAEPIFLAERDSTSDPIHYRYIRPLRMTEMLRIQDPRFAFLGVSLLDPAVMNPLWGILVVEHSAASATRALFINRMYILLAGLFAGALASLVFYVITTRLILSPVRVLREAAERVARGDLHTRSEIATGDEFEELSNTFNSMLASLKASQDQLRKANKSLSLKLNELAESNVVLHESNRVKSEFLANVSHELKTPLTSILGFADVLRDLDPRTEPDDPVSEKRRRYLDNIVRSGRSLLDLVNDLLTLARIEAGRVEIQPEPMDVREVGEGLLTLIRPQADRKNITLSLMIPPSIPTVETDPARFQQIVFNFLSNAVKFTPPGGQVSLSAKRVVDRERGEMVRVSVADTGPGIRPEDREIIFEKFRQVDAGHAREHEGTGLGLAICRELAGLLNGWVGVESEYGRGATFSLHLPTRIVPDRPSSLMPESSATR